MPAGWTPRAEKRAGTEDSDLGYGNNACGWDKCSREGDTYGVYPDGPPHMEKWGSGPEQDPKKIRAAKLNANLRRRRKELDGYRKHFEQNADGSLSKVIVDAEGNSWLTGFGGGLEESELGTGFARTVEGYNEGVESIVYLLAMSTMLMLLRFSRPSTPWAESTNLTLPSLGLPSKYGEASIRSQLTLRKHEAKADIRSPTEDSSAPILTYKPLGQLPRVPLVVDLQPVCGQRGCNFSHAPVPGLKQQPLTCPYWPRSPGNTGAGCNKAEETCQFAHYHCEPGQRDPEELKRNPIFADAEWDALSNVTERNDVLCN
ncbi:hypothetical protein PG996_010648 [Apiospora saccharicola]|uniref:C3H1-type domain-containing protein n=1 Tax=Apiospora saccharicola TaxID=335842 RepID=A0ABR1UP65_9PEZI